MPVRKIPKNYLVVTGGYSSRKSAVMDGFESLLEKEFLMLLDFDDTVDKFEVQPVHIRVPGVPRGYVPDILVHYRADLETGEVRKPLLTEVKHTDDLKRNEAKYAPKFAAAHAFAEEQGWEFRVVNQNDIRTPRLANLKFLREYRNITPSAEDAQHVLTGARQLLDLTLQKLLSELSTTEVERLHWLPIIWSMIYTRQLCVNMNQPFFNDMPIKIGASK
jgi:hypothetical protein